MKRIVLTAMLVTFATAAFAQDFYTLKPGKEAWWLRASFNPVHADIRGIPVRTIRPNWCKATEYTAELLKDLLSQDGAGNTMKEGKLSFAVEGYFDRTKVKQLALVGVYQECNGRKGSFLLIIDQGARKVRFVDTTPGDAQFAAVGANKSDIVFTSCLECDGGGTLRWNSKKKAFGWVRTRGD